MKTVVLEKVLKKVQLKAKVPRTEFLDTGKYPVVSQEQGIVNGYWDNPEDVMSFDKPVIVFGDHTKILKLIDFEFVLGADGAKVLDPIDGVDTRYLYYVLKSIKLDDLGYARHYRLLKNKTINYPESLEEQKRIVKKLDEVFAAIDKAIKNTEKNLENVQELFEASLAGAFESEAKISPTMSFREVCLELFAGGDVPKSNHSKAISEKYKIPIYSNGIKNAGLYGYTNSARVSKPSVTISARGTIGHAELREFPFLPVVRLIVLTPNVDLMNPKYLYYAVRNINFSNTGSSIPQLTIPMIKGQTVPVPSIIRQNEISRELENVLKTTQKLQKLYQQKLNDLEELRQSYLKQAFRGKL